MQGIRHTVFGYAVSFTARAHTHKGMGAVLGCAGGGGGYRGRRECGVCAYGGGRRPSGPHIHISLFLPLLNSCFGATAVRREKQRGRFFFGMCVCVCGVNAACRCVRKSEGAVLEIPCVYKQEAISL